MNYYQPNDETTKQIFAILLLPEKVNEKREKVYNT